jgi:hypothetical protein
VRGRLAVVGAIGVLLTWAAGPALGAEDADTVSSAPNGVITQDGTVALSGTYRCSPEWADQTVVNSALVTGSSSSSVGDSAPAVCDGREHSWSNQGRPYLGASSGPATVEVSLVHLHWTSSSFVPEIQTVADQRQDVTLASRPS